MPWKKDGTYVPVPDDRTFDGKRFSLLWVTGFSSKRRAEQTKNALKERSGKSYNVRIVPYDGGYYLYTAPRVTWEDSSWLLKRIGGL